MSSLADFASWRTRSRPLLLTERLRSTGQRFPASQGLARGSTLSRGLGNGFDTRIPARGQRFPNRVLPANPLVCRDYAGCAQRVRSRSTLGYWQQSASSALVGSLRDDHADRLQRTCKADWTTADAQRAVGHTYPTRSAHTEGASVAEYGPEESDME
jgi:hypothetical protein